MELVGDTLLSLPSLNVLAPFFVSTLVARCRSLSSCRVASRILNCLSLIVSRFFCWSTMGETVFLFCGVCVTTSAGAVQTNGFVEKYRLAGLFPLLLLCSSAGSFPAVYRDGLAGCGLCVFDSEDSDFR